MRKLLKLKPSKRMAFMAGLVLAGVSAVFAVVPVAHAAYGKAAYDAGGYTAWRGYFKDVAPVFTAGWDVLPRRAAYGDNSMPVITDPGSLVNFLRDNYNESINSDTQDTTGDFNFGWRKTGSAFIGWTMLGVAPGNMGPPGTIGSRETSPDWNELLNRLNALNAAGKISWNVPVSTANYGGVNTRYLGAPYDDVQAVSLPSSVGNGIIFRDYSNNDVYVLRYNCANPLGDLPGLPAVQNWTASASANGPASVFPGQTITFSYNIHNNGPGSAPITQYGTRYELYNGGTGLGWANTPGPGDASETLPPGGDITTHRTWSYTVPANYTGNQICTWISYIPESSSTGGWKESNHFCTNITQPQPSCNGFSTSPSSVEPNVPFSTNSSVNFQSQQAAFWAYQSGGKLFVTISGPGYSQTKVFNGPPPVASDISAIQSFPAILTTGVYTVTYGIQGGVIGNITCTAPIVPPLVVGYHPYFRVDAGDITAGAGFTKTDGTCTASTAAQIRGSNKGASGAPTFLGAGAQLGALALGAISGFPTATNEGGSSSGVGAGTGTGLTFANSPSLGSFGALPCMTDYATQTLTNASSVSALASGDYNLSMLSDGVYKVSSGDVSLHGSLPQGRHVTIVVMGGNAFITGDITYGGYPNMAAAPQFQLIVANGGNIKIENDVTELHGAYMALPDTTVSPATGGTLSTCYDPSTGADSVDFNTCNTKLTFYGAVVANILLLERTYGSLTANPSQGVQVQPAETFNDTPELWAVPGLPTATGAQTYDSVVSLPPVL